MSQVLVKPEQQLVDPFETFELWEYFSWLEDLHIVNLCVEGNEESFTSIEINNARWLKINEIMQMWGINLNDMITSAILIWLGDETEPYDAMLCMAIHSISTKTYWYTGEYLVG